MVASLTPSASATPGGTRPQPRGQRASLLGQQPRTGRAQAKELPVTGESAVVGLCSVAALGGDANPDRVRRVQGRRPQGRAGDDSVASRTRRPVGRSGTATGSFRSLKGSGFKANYVDVLTGEQFWISGPKKDGSDRLYGEHVPVEIDVGRAR